MPLTMSPKGKEVTIQRISGKDEVRRHLEELGFVAGGLVTVVSEAAGNPTSISLKPIFTRSLKNSTFCSRLIGITSA